MKRTKHTRKFNAEARAAIARILAEDVSDKALRFVSVVDVEVSADKSFMRVFISCDPDRYTNVQKALVRAKGYIRSCLATEFTWRVVPELDFKIDTTEDEAARIEKVLKVRPPFMVNDEDYE